jgi:hypothetical protein
LRTYAEALGLDAKLIVDEYKVRHERLSEVELQPISPASAGRERRRAPSGPIIPRGAVIVAVFALLIIALYALGTSSDDNGDSGAVATTTTGDGGATGRTTPARSAPAPPRRPSRVRLQVVATGSVFVCLRGGDRTLVNGQTMQAGDKTDTFLSKRFKLTLGNNSVRLRINGKDRGVPASPDAIGLQITPRRGRQPLPANQRPTCQQ